MLLHFKRLINVLANERNKSVVVLAGAAAAKSHTPMSAIYHHSGG